MLSEDALVSSTKNTNKKLGFVRCAFRGVRTAGFAVSATREGAMALVARRDWSWVELSWGGSVLRSVIRRRKS